MRSVRVFLVLFALANLFGCAAKPVPWGTGEVQAVVKPLRVGSASGSLAFVQQGRLVHISGTISGLPPGAHGLHIHVRRDCASQAASPADPHFNPYGKRHGSPASAEHHAGDLPMLVAGQNGVARYDVLMEGLKLSRDSEGILGRALVVKAGPDDSTTQPGGNAGPGVACGIIEYR